MKARDYDAWYDTDRGRWIGETEYRLLRALLPIAPGSSTLDVGCGTGWFTRHLAADGVDVTGVDVDPEALRFARTRGDGSARYVEGDARALPFGTGSFDGVISITALCFVADWPRAVAEIVRVSRGRFALGLLNRHSLLWRAKGPGGGVGAYQGAHWHTKREIADVLATLAVKQVRYRYGVFIPSGTLVARCTEGALPSRLPFGSFLAVGGCVDERGRSERNATNWAGR